MKIVVVAFSTVGVRQGDPLVPLLFSIVLHAIVKAAEVDQGGTIFNKM